MRVQTFSKRRRSALAQSRICFAPFWRKPAFHRFLGKAIATAFSLPENPQKTQHFSKSQSICLGTLAIRLCIEGRKGCFGGGSRGAGRATFYTLCDVSAQERSGVLAWGAQARSKAWATLNVIASSKGLPYTIRPIGNPALL